MRQRTGEGPEMNKALIVIAAVVVAGAIFWLSSQSAATIGATGLTGTLGTHTDEIAHAFEYCLLCAVVFGVLLVWQRRVVGVRESPRRLLLLGLAAVVIAVVYAVSDEFHQSFVPGRTPEYKDLMVDAIGSVVGATGCALARTALRAHTNRAG